MRLLPITLIFSLLFQFVPTEIIAQSISKNLNQYYQALYNDHEMNGNITFAENGKVIYQHSFGFADVATQQPNVGNSQFELASVSKLFTSVAILQLKEKGLINLDSPFQHYFPEFPYADITIRHLLSHTSGLPDIEDLIDSILSKNPDKQFTIQDDLQNVLIYSRSHLLNFKPGEKWGYSSAGYHLLGLLVEKISGETLAAYTQNHIFKPAGMRNSYVQTSMAQKAQPNRTKNYQYKNHFELKLQFVDTLSDLKEWAYNLALETGGSGIMSTAGDLLRFDAALTNGKLLQQATQEEAYTPYRLNNGQPAQPFDLTYCGLGWFIFKDTTHGRIVWGSGANPGTISLITRNLANHQCLVVLHNIKCNAFNDLKALDILNGEKASYHASLAFIYAQDLFTSGAEQAQTHLHQLIGDTAHYELREAELNRAALEFRRAGLKKEALSTDEQHIRSFPKSAAGYKDYAKTLVEYGRKQDAIAQYKKVLELNPDDKESADALKKLTEN